MKIYKTLAVAAAAAIAGITTYNANKSQETLSDLQLENIEALGSAEVPPAVKSSCPNYTYCPCWYEGERFGFRD